jgi:hypothetical protein
MYTDSQFPLPCHWHENYFLQMNQKLTIEVMPVLTLISMWTKIPEYCEMCDTHLQSFTYMHQEWKDGSCIFSEWNNT